MPRQARIKSENGLYHLITKGNGSQILFVDRDDHLYFLSLLERFSREFSVSVLAYCLMDNHVHLIVRDINDNVSTFMRKLDVSYSLFFNKKYERSGHLFHDRYKSEAIDSDVYLLRAFRYVLNNPQKAGICSADEYEWNSYRLYGDRTSFVDTSILQDQIGDPDEYQAFIAGENDDTCMEFENRKHDDEWGLEIIRELFGVSSGTMLQTWPWEKRNAAIRALKKKGMTIRQIERLTGINRGTIQKA